MGRINAAKKKSVFGIRGLGRRWLLSTSGILGFWGVICVLLISIAFARYSYSAFEADVEARAESAVQLLHDDLSQDYDHSYLACVSYVQNHACETGVQLYFIDTAGEVVASSKGCNVGGGSAAADVFDAISSGVIAKYIGTDPDLGERVVAISAPLVLGTGETVGVLRYVASTSNLDLQIVLLSVLSLLLLILLIAAVLICNYYYIRGILGPLGEITEKAQKITNGSYGIQIQTKYDDEIGELVEAINEMSNQINQNEKMQSEFISSLSHELRTPLTAITGWSETLLSSEDLSEDAKRGMKIIHKEAGRLTEMVLELLEFTRIQDGRMTLHMESVDIRAEFEDTIFMYGSRLAQDGIKLEYVENDVDIPEISCDPQRLRQVFLNILDNAAKHGSEGKRIEASIMYEDDIVTVVIRDFGCGIPQDELPLVKKKFYKGGSKARGSGIGLAVCDEIVNLHGGTLSLANAPGGGTQVTIEIPISQ